MTATKGQLRPALKRRLSSIRRTLGWYIGLSDLEGIWAQQGGHCGLTGQVLNPVTATIDHIVPTSRGGTHELDNLRWATPAANHAKGNLLDHEFLALCHAVIKFLPDPPPFD